MTTVPVQAKCLTGRRTDFAKAIRKEYDQGKIKPGRRNLKQLEPREDGNTNTLTSVPSDNYIQYDTSDSMLRRLTEIECERLQGFPDDWTKWGDFNGERVEISTTQRSNALGNAVTASMVEMLAKRLLTK